MAQIFTENGFVMLFPNVRGSTGYGVEFRDACVYDPGGKDLDDIESAVIYLKSLDFVDPSNIGITGASYGGYMTYLAMTKRPDYWKAGVAVAGVTSLIKMHEKVKITFPALCAYFEELNGVPNTKEVLDLWEDRSAINFANHMKGKLKIIHTVNDPRCPVDQAYIFIDKLLLLGKQEGVDFESNIFEDFGHSSDAKEFRKRELTETLDFFIKIMKI